jgi:hypothetical protein
MAKLYRSHMAKAVKVLGCCPENLQKHLYKNSHRAFEQLIITRENFAMCLV